VSAAVQLQDGVAVSPRGAMELRLQCPACRAPIGFLPADERPSLRSCPSCSFQMAEEHGIWRALPANRAAYYAKFMREYQAVRETEGRGSSDSEYYLALPYRDLSGCNEEQWTIRARTYSFLERKLLPRFERRRPGALNILDLGAGNGWLSFRLALRGHLPVAIDLLASELDGLGAATHYRQKLPALFARFQAELDSLPFEEGQFDLAIFNASFHYSEQYGRTLGEAIRCLRPGGSVILTDTAWYKHDESGQRMLKERRAAFVARFGFPSDGLASLEYLTDSRLAVLQEQLGIRWKTYSPYYGLRWAMRPLAAKLKRKREPSRFRIYVAEVAK